MDTSSVLTALQEMEKWRGRKRRLEADLARLRQRRAALERELERVRRDLGRLAEILYVPGEAPVDHRLLPPFRMGD